MINNNYYCYDLHCSSIFKFEAISVIVLRMEDMGGVHNTLDEEHIIFGVIFVVKDGQFAELRTP